MTARCCGSLFCTITLLANTVPAADPPSYDVIVYGGTSAGITAAIQAKKMGKSVVLIEPGQHLGGLTSGGLGATDIGNKAAIGGLSREFYRRIGKHYQNDAAWTWEQQADYKSRRQATTELGNVDVRAARRRAGLSRLVEGARRGRWCSANGSI